MREEIAHRLHENCAELSRPHPVWERVNPFAAQNRNFSPAYKYIHFTISQIPKLNSLHRKREDLQLS